MSKKMSREQLQELTAVVVRAVPRDLDSEVAQRWIVGEGQATLRGVLDRALREGPPPPMDPDAWVDELDLTRIERREFEIVIDPTKTIEQMVAAGNYSYANPNHTTAIFGSCRKVTGNKPVKAKVVAFRIGRNATREQAKRLRARLNLGEVCIQHELALGAQHKRAQQELGWIVNVDDVVLVGGDRYVSCLYGGDALRGLDLDGACYGWRVSTWSLGLLSEPA